MQLTTVHQLLTSNSSVTCVDLRAMLNETSLFSQKGLIHVMAVL